MFGDLDKYLMVFFTGLLVTYLLTPACADWPRILAWSICPMRGARTSGPPPAAAAWPWCWGLHAACLLAVLFPWPHWQVRWISAGGKNLPWRPWCCRWSGRDDDVRGMRPLMKLGGQIAAPLVMWLSGTHFGHFLGHDLPAAGGLRAGGHLAGRHHQCVQFD